jgi:plastocyanin
MRRISASAVIAAVLAGLPSAMSPPATAAPGHMLVVNAYEYTFQAPDSIAAGVVTVRLVNHGKVGHQVALARLDDSSSLARVMKMLVDDKAHTGGIRWSGRVEGASPGGAGETILALPPGRYVIVCAYDDDYGHPHTSMAMIRALVVTSGKIAVQ